MRKWFGWIFRRVLLPCWRAILAMLVHLIFFLPIPLPELKPQTKAGKAFLSALQKDQGAIRSLADDALATITTQLEDEVKSIRSSVSEVRSRAAQLLGVTGVVAVLAGLGTTTQSSSELVPTKGIAQVLTLIFAGLVGYALIGTLWLTVQALAVRSWDEAKTAPFGKQTRRRMDEIHAAQLYEVRRRLAIRLSRPAGYLRDAYWYFFSTVVFVATIVGIRLVATAIAK